MTRSPLLDPGDIHRSAEVVLVLGSGEPAGLAGGWPRDSSAPRFDFRPKPPIWICFEARSDTVDLTSVRLREFGRALNLESSVPSLSWLMMCPRRRGRDGQYGTS